MPAMELSRESLPRPPPKGGKGRSYERSCASPHDPAHPHMQREQSFFGPPSLAAPPPGHRSAMSKKLAPGSLQAVF